MSLTGRPFLRRGPSGPLAAQIAGLIQCGYDQPEKSQPLPTSGPTSVIPRTALAPLQVQLPDVVPGNILETDFSLQIFNEDDTNPITIGVIPAVSFNGSVVIAPAAGWFGMNNGMAYTTIPPLTYSLMRGLIAVTIPDGSTIATVQLVYSTTADGLSIGGTDSALIPGIPGSTLKVSEIAEASVPQPGPSTLLAF